MAGLTGLSYFSNGRLVRLSPVGPGLLARGKRRLAKKRGAAPPSSAEVSERVKAVRSTLTRAGRAPQLFRTPATADVRLLAAKEAHAAIVPTETFLVESPTKAVEKWLKDSAGCEKVDEGSQGKVLFRVPPGARDGVALAFKLSREVYERGGVKASHPNFVRSITKLGPSRATKVVQWALHNEGETGLYGADVGAHAAWTITKGVADVVVAVLDEGVDTLHTALKAAVFAQADFVEDHDTAAPDGDDAHGTACAGIAVSRSSSASGLAPRASLMAVRIAKSDGAGNWIFDDFRTADAIDWAWQHGAHVLSNSWGGGPPVDGITNAFERARTQGRGGKGCVVVIAAGNEEGSVSYPGTLPEVLTVGASNQWDQRKTRTSRDGEDWWGSNSGPALDLLAPGVQIRTTDIRGSRGYDLGSYTNRFNGTSSATPHVAGAAALILSAAPDLTEGEVREAIKTTCDRVPGQKGWNVREGHGRLNAYAALRAALR